MNRNQNKLGMIRTGAISGVIILLLIAGGWALLGGEETSPRANTAAAAEDGQYWTVDRGPLTISLLAPGSIEAKETTPVICEVEGDVKIIWIIPEGTIVEKGQKIVELEASGLSERLVNQQIQVSSAQAQYDEAVQNLEIQKRQNESNIQSAENKLELAKIDLEKYKEGELKQTLLQRESAITVAEAELAQAEDTLVWSEKLLEEGYVSSGEKRSDELDVTRQKLEVEKARNALQVFQNYEQRRELLRLQNALREAEDELDRTRLRSQSELRNKEIAMESTGSKLELEQLRLKQLEDQQAATVIHAPTDGMVVYANEGYRGNDEQIQAGTQVRNRQKIIDLPDFSAWQVETRVHESLIRQVEVGKAALITIDAMPDKHLSGIVSRISVLPEQGRWFMPDTKEYTVDIDISTTSLQLKPGMTAKTEIILNDLEDVLYVPIQSVVTLDGKAQVWAVNGEETRPQPVELGPANDRFVVVRSGIEEDDRILMTARQTGSTGSMLERPSRRRADEQNRPQMQHQPEEQPASDITEGEQTVPSTPDSQVSKADNGAS